MRIRMITCAIGQTIPILQNPRCQWVFAMEQKGLGKHARNSRTGAGLARRTDSIVRGNPRVVTRLYGPGPKPAFRSDVPFKHGSVPSGACSEEIEKRSRA